MKKREEAEEPKEVKEEPKVWQQTTRDPNTGDLTTDPSTIEEKKE